MPKKLIKNLPPPSATPLESSLGDFYETKASTQTRRNSSSVNERTDRFKNIDDGLVPFRYSTNLGVGSSSVDVREAIILTQKAYYNFAVFRNVIELMTEFSVSDIYFKGGSAKTREFFEALFNKINVWNLQDNFFREYYRSGNVFIFRHDSELNKKDAESITQIYGEKKSSIKLPARYEILNPADIQLSGSSVFADGRYYKILSDYELSALRNPRTGQDKEILESFTKQERDKIKNAASGSTVVIELDPQRFLAVFCKKQHYEPFAVPIGFPVLELINWKQEMLKMDMATARTMQQAILLVTLGAEPEKGGVNQKHLEAMQTIFKNQSVGRVLVADYTTDAKFVIPDIADILDPKKYEIVNEDINNGLNNILVGGEKFANQTVKTKVFIGRLVHGRKSFLNDFLIPEIKRISEVMGFKSFPHPCFDDVALEDNVNLQKICVRLMELGILTPEQGILALENNRLPTEDDSEESQQRYKTLRDKGLYAPLVGGSVKNEEGRPPGSKSPQTTKNVSPIGASFSFSKLKEALVEASKLDSVLDEYLKKKHGIKKLSSDQKAVKDELCTLIVANEDQEKWLDTYKEYCKNPVDKNPEKVKKIREIAATHELDFYLASLLYASKNENNTVNQPTP